MKKKLYVFVCLSFILLISGCSPYNAALYKTTSKSKNDSSKLSVTEKLQMKK